VGKTSDSLIGIEHYSIDGAGAELKK